MNKIIATGSLLAMTAMGMACGGSSTNVNANLANHSANNTNAVVIPVNTATPMSTPMSTGNTNSSMSNSSTSNSTMKSNTMSPAGNANAKSTPATANKPANK